jgi:ABC-type transport system substrate-binding protein
LCIKVVSLVELIRRDAVRRQRVIGACVMRTIGAAMCVAGLALPAGAQSARHSYTIPHVLRYATAEDIVGLNPHLDAQGTLAYMSSLTMAWLIKYDHANRPIPELATIVPTLANHGISPDGKTITYHLRGDAKWSDGVPFTSDDVKFSVAVVQDAANNEVTHEGFDDVTAVDTPNRTTAVFHLRRPYSGFYVNFFSSTGANPCLLPKHAFGSTKINTAPYNDLPIGIGPSNIRFGAATTRWRWSPIRSIFGADPSSNASSSNSFPTATPC